MLHRIQNYFATLTPVFIDGLIYVMLAVLSSWVGILSSDEARAFIGKTALFWTSAGIVTTNSGLLALKMFRSTTFADHQQDKKDALQSNALQQVASLLQSTQTNKEK